MTPVAEQTGAWLESFTRQPAAAPWVQQLREAAFRRFSELGLPTTHDEDWRFTNVAPIARTRFRAAEPAPEYSIPERGGIELTFVNGFLVKQSASLPKGVTIGGLSAEGGGLLGQPLLAAETVPIAQPPVYPFAVLNTAFLNTVAVVRIARGTVVEEPIQIVYFNTGKAGSLPHFTHPRTLIVAGPDTQCAIVERYAGEPAEYFTNAVTEIVAGNGAVIDHYKVQQEGAGAFHIGGMFISLGQSANFTSSSIALGGSLVRNDVHAALSEGSEATLNGLYVVNGSQHVDNHTSIDHAKPHGTSHELYKGILDGRSAAVFNGRVMVRKDAQKTDSKQTNKNLVLSDEAVVNTKPELQIFADDVRCTHGATIGQLDAESMFYLQSRGIGKADARNLLTYAFAQDVVDRIKIRGLREPLEHILFEKFHERPE